MASSDIPKEIVGKVFSGGKQTRIPFMALGMYTRSKIRASNGTKDVE
jgi:hypothetical protein